MHHLKPQWVAAFRRGELDFGDREKGLAAVLGKADSQELLTEVREILRSGELRGEARVALLKALLLVGAEPADLQLAMAEAASSAEVLLALAKRDRPEFAVDAALLRAVESGDEALQIAALDLVRHWRVQELQQNVLKAMAGAKAGTELFSSAVRAFGALAGKDGISLLAEYAGSFDRPQPAALRAILEIDAAAAAREVAGLFQHVQVSSGEAVREILTEFAAREGTLKLLGAELSKGKIAKDQGAFLREQWLATGVVDAEFSALLDGLAGVQISGFEFSDALVKELAEAAKQGDRARGQKIFGSARAGCAACHRVGKIGGVIGPDLSAVGSGVLPERIVTEVVWPARQAKEGYSLTRVTLKGGQVLQGYEQENRDDKVVLLRDFASTEMHEIRKDSIAKKEALGSLMPATAQGLSKEELADLCAYLISLRGLE